jgi:hypothetical protein
MGYKKRQNFLKIIGETKMLEDFTDDRDEKDIEMEKEDNQRTLREGFISFAEESELDEFL